MILSGKRAEGDIEVFSTLIGKMSISDQLMKELLAFCIMKPVDMRLDTIPTEVGVILRSLHQKYFPLMDPTIAALTKANTDPLVHGLIADIFRDTVSEPFADGSATLLLTLEHPQAVVRLLALERLEEILEADPTFEYSLLKDTFLNRINDNSAEIVSFVLDMPQLSQMVGTQLIPTLITLISRNGTGVIIKSKAISLLLGMGDLAAYERVFEEAVLGAILLTSTDNTELASFMKLLPVLLKFLNIDDMSTINLLIDQPQDDKNRKSLCSKINLEIIKMLSADVMKTPSRYLSALKSSQLLVRIAASLALNKAISDKPSANILAAQTYMEHMKSCLKTGTLDLGPDSASINGLPSLTFMNRLFKIGDNFETHLVQISAMCVAASLESARPAPCIWLDRKANGYTGAIIRMAEIFSEVRTIKFRDELLRQLIVRHGKNSTVELCCSIALSESSAARAIFLTLLSKLIGKLDFQLLVPVLLVSLHHSDIQTRKAAAVAITRLQASYNVEKDAAAPQIYGHGAFYGESSRNLQLLKSQSALELVSGIAARATEMTVDENYVMQCIESVVNPRKGLRENLLLFLVSNVIASTNLAFRNALLNVISRIESPVKLNCMSKLIAHELESKEISDLMYSGALLRCYNPKSIVGSRAVKHIKILSEVFKSTANESLQRVAIDLITPDFFAAMDPKGQRCILSQLLELFATGQQKFSDYAKLKLKDVMISDLLVRPLFDSMITKLTQDSTEKRRKTDQESSDTTILQLVQLLEIMLNNQIVNSISLIKDLFSVFNSILDLQMTEVFSAIEYSKQLLMNLIMKFTQLTDVGEINEEEYRVDLIIHCIRGTENSQTHHIALLLLAEIGSRAPNLVLLHMMPVFTFMGSQVINQDDNYSFSVIEETLKVIVPALIKGNGEQAEIMNVFVNALVHIPSHRRLKLFSTLGHTLSASKLGPLLALIVTASIRSKAKDIDLNAFGLSLLGQFEYGRQISAISGILALIQDEGEFFGSYDAKIHRKIDFQLAQFAKYCLSNGSVALDSCDSALHIELVEMILSLTTKYSAGSSKFEAAMSESLYGCLHDANANLTLGLFLSVVCSLLRHTNAIVQQKAILLLQERINVLGVDIREEDFSSALDVLVDLIQVSAESISVHCY